MRCLSGVCENGQLLVDIFVNYDCDLEGANLFERMVLALVRMAQSKQFHEGPTVPSPEEHALRQTVRISVPDGTCFRPPRPWRWGCSVGSPCSGLSRFCLLNSARLTTTRRLLCVCACVRAECQRERWRRWVCVPRPIEFS